MTEVSTVYMAPPPPKLEGCRPRRQKPIALRAAFNGNGCSDKCTDSGCKGVKSEPDQPPKLSADPVVNDRLQDIVKQLRDGQYCSGEAAKTMLTNIRESHTKRINKLPDGDEKERLLFRVQTIDTWANQVSQDSSIKIATIGFDKNCTANESLAPRQNISQLDTVVIKSGGQTRVMPLSNSYSNQKDASQWDQYKTLKQQPNRYELFNHRLYAVDDSSCSTSEKNLKTTLEHSPFEPTKTGSETVAKWTEETFSKILNQTSQQTSQNLDTKKIFCSKPCCHRVGSCSHSKHSHPFPSKLDSGIVAQLDQYLIKSPNPECHKKGKLDKLLNRIMPSAAGSCRSCGQAAQTIGLSSDEMASTQNVRDQDKVSGYAETGAEHIADTAVSAGVGLLGAVGALFSLKMLWSTRKEAKNIARISDQHQTLKTTQRRFLRLKQAGLVLGIAAGSLVATASVASIVGATWPGFVVMGSVGLVCAVGMVGTHIASQAYRYYSVQQNQKSLPSDSQYAYQDQKKQAMLGGAVGTVFAGTIIASAVVASPVMVPVLAVALCAHALCNTSMQSATSHHSNTMDLLTDTNQLTNQKTRHEVLTSLGFIKVGYTANAIDYLRWGGGKTWQWLKSWVHPTAEPYVVVRARQVLSDPSKQGLIQEVVDPQVVEPQGTPAGSKEYQLARAYEHYYYVNPSVTDIVYGRQAGILY